MTFLYYVSDFYCGIVNVLYQSLANISVNKLDQSKVGLGNRCYFTTCMSYNSVPQQEEPVFSDSFMSSGECGIAY